MSANSQKGRLVEAIVAQLNEDSGVTIERNARLAVSDDPNDSREIDVLVTGGIAECPIRIVFECKNYGAAIGVELIDAFVGKLIDVDIPSQCGIYVSTMGFTKGAFRRAKKAGIQLLLLDGLTNDRMESQIIASVQSIVHLLMGVERFSISTSVEKEDASHFPNEQYEGAEGHGAIFINQSGEVVTTAGHVFWKSWLLGQVPRKIGTHSMKLTPPAGLYVYGKGTIQRLVDLEMSAYVHGYVIAITGTATRHRLLDAVKSQVKKDRVDATFEMSESMPRSVLHFESEEALDAHISSLCEPIKVTSRLPLPRIRMGHIYFPLSARVQKQVEERIGRIVGEAERTGTNPKFGPSDLEGVESLDLSGVWEN